MVKANTERPNESEFRSPLGVQRVQAWLDPEQQKKVVSVPMTTDVTYNCGTRRCKPELGIGGETTNPSVPLGFIRGSMVLLLCDKAELIEDKGTAQFAG